MSSKAAKAKPAPRTKDVKGLALARKQSKMTREEWRKFNVGMKAKWPLPEYLDRPDNTYFHDETFERVTRWMAETKIKYRPHAKTPGTKSHVRYERYSKATTVGMALELGTWPADWCWDYERGYIKVLGPVRDEPIDITSASEDKDLTEVDRAVNSWYKRELAKKLGLNLSDIIDGKYNGESTIMRAHRLVAQRLCQRILADATAAKRCITDEEVTLVLKEWAFARNQARVNVMQKEVSWVWSDTIGLLRDRVGDIHLTPSTKAYPEFLQVLSKWLTDRLPAEARDFKFTSLNVNKDYAAKIHRDGNNFGPSMISAFGDFSGGALNYWAEDDGSEKDLENLNSCDKSVFDLRHNLAMFNGNCAHSVEDFEGNRFSVVYFTLGCHAKMKDEDRDALKSLGVPVPAVDEDPYQIIRPPAGERQAKRLPTHCRQNGRSHLPASHCWSKAALSSGPCAKPLVLSTPGKGAAQAGKSVSKGAKAVKKSALKFSKRSFIAGKAKGAKSLEACAQDKRVIIRLDKEVWAAHIAERLKKIAGRQVDEVVGKLRVATASGEGKIYRGSDLTYDISKGYIVVQEPSGDAAEQLSTSPTAVSAICDAEVDVRPAETADEDNRTIIRTDKAAKSQSIAKRLTRIAGRRVDEVIGHIKFTDTAGNTRTYNQIDMKYDIYLGYIFLEKADVIKPSAATQDKEVRTPCKGSNKEVVTPAKLTKKVLSPHKDHTSRSGKEVRSPAKDVITRGDKTVRLPYIADRIEKITGRTVDEVVGAVEFKDASGNTKTYGRPDLKYDIGHGYIVLGEA